MKIVEINSVPYGSTARIMFELADILKNEGHGVICTSGYTWGGCERSDWFETSNVFEKSIHMCLSYITGRNGCYSYLATKRLLKKVSAFNPELIHLHNLHGWYINIPLLFDYVKEHNIPVVWTLHDCWSFTGQCPHFKMVNCNKWKNGCYQCPQFRDYPSTLVDRVKIMWNMKKKWFSHVSNMTIVTPSQWLANLVNQSYLKEYPVKVINNGIDLATFKPTIGKIRDEYKIPQNKFVILGVAFGWGVRKGLDVFIELSKRLDNEKFQIVLVGTDDKVDKQLLKNIISIHRIQNQSELAEIYSASDLFINPTREENYPTVNMEAIACGIPVVTFNTGGSPEIVDENTGSVVEYDDIDGMELEIKRICENRPYSMQTCIERAKSFDMHSRFKEYVELYEGLTNNGKN